MNRFTNCFLQGSLGVLCLLLTMPLGLFGQNCECTKEHRKIVEKEKDRWQHGAYKGELDIKQHPYTTFSKFHSGSYYEKGTTATSRLTHLCSMVQDFQSNVVSDEVLPEWQAKEIYRDLYDFANKRIPVTDEMINGDPSDGLGSKSKFPHNTAYIAKNAAFVYLCNIDKDGNPLHDTVAARFRNKAIKCLEFIGDKDKNVADMVVAWNSALTGDMSTFSMRYTKNLIMYLQAYDYLMV